ncbi:MAG: hypothetical protein ABS944_01175 [Solibacillus sp.]|jgi:hypothetical protein|uniref:hypothetical protein n=1 Tax=unclassified Solibacillus TaxID=2637870 RepID=UPI0030F9AACB
MTTGLIIVLFLIQLITIFIIVLLNSKLSKFKDLENRQNQLVEEMDNAISVYLIEMKEENDRLIKELQNTQASKKMESVTEEKAQSSTIPIKTNSTEIEDSLKLEETAELEARPYVPIKTATNAYSKQKAHIIEEDEVLEVQEVLFRKEKERKILTFEQQVLEHYRNGKSTEEIAKMMQRGKTEIDLLIKFHA